jgi:type II secretory ATPase GspE/PulE/Tfp pilus assembly ATPase PilB-like protein
MEPIKNRIITALSELPGADKKALKQIAIETHGFAELKKSLMEKCNIPEEDILLILAREYKIPYFDLDKYRLSPESKSFVPKDIAFKYKILPISRIGDVLTIATTNPLDIIALDDIKIACAFKKIDLVLANGTKILKSLNSLYSDKQVPDMVEQKTNEELDVQEIVQKSDYSLDDILKESKRSPIVRVVDLIIYEGLKRRASDLHVEPTAKDLTVRYRIDGVLHQGLTLPKINQSAITARLKIMSGMNITEFRIPQDGRFRIKFENREIDFRVSILPTNFGEKVVLRVLDRQSLSFGLEHLGFSNTPLEVFEDSLKAPFGIILVTGPTGSGKSTTLYSVITRANKPERNIITIEDPVEYQLEGITQIQVHAEIGLTFAASLRSVLRQSPDIVMVGEIRDSETADIAIKASLTGQFIFSTLHTNNSIGAVTRLADMGIEPFLIASSLIASTAQRLVRKLCPNCKEQYTIDGKLLEKMHFSPDRTNTFFRAVGCNACNKTGYRGRVALMEVFSLDENIRNMIVKKASEDDIATYAIKNRKFEYLKNDGFEKCVQGLTTLEEVLRVAG